MSSLRVRDLEKTAAEAPRFYLRAFACYQIGPYDRAFAYRQHIRTARVRALEPHSERGRLRRILTKEDLGFDAIVVVKIPRRA